MNVAEIGGIGDIQMINKYWVIFYLGTPETIYANSENEIYRRFPGNVIRVTRI